MEVMVTEDLEVLFCWWWWWKKWRRFGGVMLRLGGQGDYRAECDGR